MQDLELPELAGLERPLDRANLLDEAIPRHRRIRLRAAGGQGECGERGRDERPKPSGNHDYGLAISAQTSGDTP